VGVTIPREGLALLEARNFGHLATLMEDGSPQVTPVWVDYDGNHVLVNTSIGRVKEKNVRRDPRVALSVIDSGNPYHNVTLRGRVVAVTEQGAREHVDKLSMKYLGGKYPWLSPGERRVILRIKPLSVHVS